MGQQPLGVGGDVHEGADVTWITLSAWAEATFNPPPSLATLRAWAASGQITPAAQRIGRRWMVREDAEYTPAAPITHERASGNLSDRARAILSV